MSKLPLPFIDNKANVLYEDLEGASILAEELSIIPLALSIRFIMLAMIDKENTADILVEQMNELKRISKKYGCKI